MKIRTGFVSNSSSSSFCIIGITSGKLIDEYIEAAKVDLENPKYVAQGVYSGGFLDLYGSCYDGDHEFYYAGVDADTLLNTMSIPKACEKLQKELKQRYKLNIPLKEIGFYYGEISDGQ